MKKTLTNILLTVIMTLTLSLTTAYARDFAPPTIPQPQTLPGQGVETKLDLVQSVLPKYAVGLVGFVAMGALVFLVIAGVRFVTAYGNEEAVETAKKQIIYSIVALLVALLSYTIVSIIINIKFEGDQTGKQTPPVQPPDAQLEKEFDNHQAA